MGEALGEAAAPGRGSPMPRAGCAEAALRAGAKVPKPERQGARALVRGGRCAERWAGRFGQRDERARRQKSGRPRGVGPGRTGPRQAWADRRQERALRCVKWTLGVGVYGANTGIHSHHHDQDTEPLHHPCSPFGQPTSHTHLHR